MSRPNSLPWMESTDAKIGRAREHLDVLDREIADFIRGTNRHFEIKVAEDRSAAWIVSWVEDPYPPIRLSLLIGDCLSNMRSALDNLICGLVRTQKPGSSCSGRAFPICADEQTYQRQRASVLKGVHEAAKRVIDSLQPFTRPAGSVQIDPLNMLNVLCNRDKHRAANLTSGFSKNTRLDIHDPGAGGIYHVSVPKLHKGDGPDIIMMPVPSGPVGQSIRVDTKGTAVLAFNDDGPWEERPVSEVLHACMNYVEDGVIRKLKPFFRQ
jgi:hypothetical protein